ncbi:MAG TPA: GNAT family protein [Candidatus Acidoferrales bacterium]|nr:GNAT family protein [Candidatus Acidoferrales bacterium]
MKAAKRRVIGRSSTARGGLPATWLAGTKVRLRPIEPQDVKMLQRWLNEPTAQEWLGALLPQSQREVERWAARISTDPGRPSFIIQTARGADIGLALLLVKDAQAELGIAIHEPRFWGQGLGEEAVRLLVDGAFRVLPLQRIELRVLPYNERAIRAYEKAGFSREGLLRKAAYHMGSPRDQLVMSILHDEWLVRRDS